MSLASTSRATSLNESHWEHEVSMELPSVVAQIVLQTCCKIHTQLSRTAGSDMVFSTSQSLGQGKTERFRNHINMKLFLVALNFSLPL